MGEPVVEYEVLDGVGELNITSAGEGGVPMGRVENEWDLRLNELVPVHMTIGMGVGELNLDLRKVYLESLSVEMGVGELDIDLSRPWPIDLEVTIDCGIGEVTIRIPSSIGVEIEDHNFIGEVHAAGLIRRGNIYVNELHGKTPTTLRIRVETSIGEIHIITGEEEIPGIRT